MQKSSAAAWIAATIATLFLVSSVSAQLFRGRRAAAPNCANGQCASPAAKPTATMVSQKATTQTAGLQWWNHKGDVENIYLYRSNTLVGRYDYATGFYREIGATGDYQSLPSKAPIPIPGVNAAPKGNGAPGSQYSFGVVQEKRKGVESWSCSGERCSKEHVYATIAAGVHDDTKEPSFTVIDKDKTRLAKIKETWKSITDRENVPPHKAQFYDATSKVTQEILRPLNLDANAKFQQTGLMILAQNSPVAPVNPGKAAAVYTFEGPNDLKEPWIKIDPVCPRPKDENWHNVAHVVMGIFLVLSVIAILLLAVRKSDHE